VIILDENILASQRKLLASRRIRTRQIGFDVGRSGMSDEDIVAFLRRQARPTFFTEDKDFYDPALCHSSYSLVHLRIETSTPTHESCASGWCACERY
jgi:hypothetical protein